MPTTAPSTTADHLVALYARLHAELAEAVAALDDAGCNWAPAEGANAVSVLVVHVLGSEAEAFGAVLGRAVERDRDEELRPQVRTRAELLDRIRAADRRLREEWAPALTADARTLRRHTALPTLSRQERRPGSAWLIANHGHAREHLGQLLLTAQLYGEARARAGVRPSAARR